VILAVELYSIINSNMNNKLEYTNYVKDYLHITSTNILETLILSSDKIVDLMYCLIQARQKRNRIYVMGNGGSAATASHLCNDLNKYPLVCPETVRFKAISLVDSIPLLTAIANDISYDEIFAEQLNNYAEPNDILIGISGSGNSKNCVAAIEVAKLLMMKTVSVVGFDGGIMAQISDLVIHTPCFDMTQCENLHMTICHTLVSLLKEVNK
jgi:D-sedoheptulose 7-phosphate isomerase